MDEAAHLLVVDDDTRTRELLRRFLAERGYRVATAADAKEAESQLAAIAFDLVVLDVMLPGEDGMEFTRRLRAAKRDVPIVLLTARGETADRISGLSSGADDYLPKPFNPRELLARIHAVLRRQPPPDSPGAPAHDIGEVRFGPFVFDPGLRTLTRDGRQVPLTGGEFSLLKVFARHPRTPLSREKLMVLARGREYGAFDRSLDVQVSRLRKLIEADPATPRYIQTVWGVGYVFVPD